jgi:hypothetical protein
MPEQSPQPDSPQQSLSGCLTRLCWMVIGNSALLIAALFIAKNHQTTFSPADIAFGLIVGVLLVVRYADIRWLNGQTSDGRQAATMRHWRRYGIFLIAISLGLWLLAHLGAHFGV